MTITGLKIIQNRIKSQDGIKTLLKSLKHETSRKSLLIFLGLMEEERETYDTVKP